MTHVKEEAICYPPQIELEKPSKLKVAMKWLRSKIDTIKGKVLIELHDKDSIGAKLALEDVTLLMAYLCKNYQAVIGNQQPLDEQLVSIVKIGGLEKLLEDIPQTVLNPVESSLQEKLLAANTEFEEIREISKRMQQIKEIAQEQKLEQQEEVNDAALTKLTKLNNYKNNVLKAKADKEALQLLIIEKLEGREQQLNVLIGGKKLNAGDLYEAVESLLTGDIVHPPGDI